MRLRPSPIALRAMKVALSLALTWESQVFMSFVFMSFVFMSCVYAIGSPLFRDSEGGMVIPQVPLFELLKKFDGQTWTDQVTKEAHVRRCYRILKLPRYLVLHLIRFTRNNFYMEKNPTIVTFPVKNFETKGLLYAAPSVRSDDEAVDAISSRGGGGKAMGKTKLNSVQRAAAELRHCDELRERCPPLGSVNNFSSEQLQDFIASFGAQLHQSQMSLLLKQSEGVARGSSIESKAPDVVSSGDAGTDMNGNRSGDESDVVRLQLLLIAKDAHKRVQLMRRCGGDDDAATVVSGSKYDLVANICHDTTSGVGQGGVAVGDLNMFAAGATAAAGGGKSKTASTASSTTASSTGSAVCNDSVLNDGAFKVHVQHKATGQWFEIQDLRVAEVSPQLIG